MDSNLNKLLNIFLYTLLGITIVVVVFYFSGGYTPETINSLYPEPVYIDFFLNWAYVLFGVTILAAVGFAILQVIRNPKNALRTFVILAIFGAIILVSYLLSDGTKMDLPGYTGTDNVESTLKFADTLLYTTYFLFVTAVVLSFSEFLFKMRR